MNAALKKRLKISETLLNRAHAALPRPTNDDSTFIELEKQFTEYVKNNEHELALDDLEKLGDLAAPRGRFWKDLMRAAENMMLPDRLPKLQKKFGDALARKRITGTA